MYINRWSNHFSFIDFLFLTLMGIMVLFVIAFMLIKPQDAKKIDPKAEYIITLDWKDDDPNDIDLWILDPNKIIVGYPATHGGMITLERDDLGSNNDIITIGDGTVVYTPTNQEVITIRTIVPGQYVVNVFYFSDRHQLLLTPGTKNKAPVYEDLTPIDVSMGGTSYVDTPVEVTVRLIKLNPKYNLVYTRKFILQRSREEKTMFQFTILPNGKIEDVHETNLPFVSRSGVMSSNDMGAGQ